ncbi:MAG TPA: 30S ribosomal protein S7 [Candidatus Peribacteraceae bacterium]|nr:30S ribosomal protein S7 [Candidatus Peribacteraceae bacterium]
MAKPVKPYIVQGSNPSIEKFINCIMKRGKKSTARRIFNDALEVIKTRTKEDPLEVFNKAVLNATPLIEVRPKRVAGSVYQVPVEVTPRRQVALSTRWILGAARERKGMPMAQKLALELLDASSEQGGAIKKKQDVIKMAQANKAFAHLAK